MVKKLLVFILAIIMTVATVIPSYADDGFSVKQSVIKLDEGLCNINIAVPYFEGFNGADEINTKIRNLVINYIGETRTMGITLEKMKEEANGESFNARSTLDIYYDYSLNGNILSVQLYIDTYSGGAHGMSFINSITANTLTGEIYSFKDLFKDAKAGTKLVDELIISSIKENPETYVNNTSQTVLDKDGEFNYYLNGNKLVVYFDLYEIAAYASGIPQFEIEFDQIKNLLKNDIYYSIEDSVERGSINYNGKSIKDGHKVIEKDMPLIPLRDMAEAMGYKISWNRNDGAIIDGKGAIKDDSQFIIAGITYVPFQFFKDTLGENIYLGYLSDGSLAVRAFSKDGYENNFDRLVKEFQFPLSEKEAVEMYADAVTSRNGAVQYGLLSDKLREKEYSTLKELSFVTGTSSPWVDSYNISKIGDNSYRIDFTLKTSVPNDVSTSTFDIKVEQVNEFWRITSIK